MFLLYRQEAKVELAGRNESVGMEVLVPMVERQTAVGWCWSGQGLFGFSLFLHASFSYHAHMFCDDDPFLVSKQERYY